MGKKKTSYPLLLTGTIDTSVFNNTNVKLTDTNIRLRQYDSTIKKYITDSCFTKIVFAENSGYEIDAESYEKLAREHNKQFEYLYVPVSIEDTIQYGKSYGEARIIISSLKNSELLKGEEIIYKCTGRVFIPNNYALCKTKTSHRSEFIALPLHEMCFTLFFKIYRDDFERALVSMDRVCNEREGMDLEKTVYFLLSKNNIKVDCFKAYPDYHGQCGTSGHKYDKKRKVLFIKNIILKLGIHRFPKYNRFQLLIYKLIDKVCPGLFW